MKKLMRRAAAGLALPLVIGAPMVLVAGPAAAATPTDTAIAVPASAVYGQEVHATATVTEDGAGTPVSDGAVQFSYQPTACSCEAINIGGPVALNAAGTAVSPVLETEDHLPFEVNTGDAPYQFLADYLPGPSATYAFSTSPYAFLTVDKAASSIAVLPTATTVVADMTGALPGGVQAGSFKPSGTVSFTLSGQPIGSAPIGENGRAVLTYSVPHGQPQSLGASYAGDSHYTGSANATVRTDPLLTARALGKLPASRSGWFRTPVYIYFICRPQGSELVADCPLDITLRKSGEGQSVTQSIQALDGGSASLTISGIDIDRVKPVITVSGSSCTATDKLSGLKGRCRLRVGANRQYVAVAVDKAGNRAVKHGLLD